MDIGATEPVPFLYSSRTCCQAGPPGNAGRVVLPASEGFCPLSRLADVINSRKLKAVAQARGRQPDTLTRLQIADEV